MATLDDSPSLFSGQQWSDWADSALSDNGIDAKESDDEDGKDDESGSMKLKRADLPLFGLCPSQDEFYLVVCDICKNVLKPQAFQRHLDVRHGGKGTYTCSTSRSSTHSMLSSSRCSVSSSPVKLSFHSSHQAGGRVPTKASVKEPPPSLHTATKVGAETTRHKDSKSKKNAINPVVKVKRISETLAMKKQHQLPLRSQFSQESSSTTSLTNGSIKSANSSPVLETEMVVSDPETKPSVSPSMADITSVSRTFPSTFISGSVSKSDPVSAKLIISPTSIAMATSTGTLTTTTVTTSSITSATLTTSATSTTSSVSLSSVNSNPSNSISTVLAGKTNFLLSTVSVSLASISVNLTSASVSTVTSSVSISNTASNSNSATATLKKFPHIEKPDKIIPLKDREFDPNKHCGVIISETGKPCTRSMTCKSHALSLRRAVPGRRLPFDELLKEHREAKEAFQKARAESKEAAAAAKAAAAANKSNNASPITSPQPKSHPVSSAASLKERVQPPVPVTPPTKTTLPQKVISPVTKRPQVSNMHIPPTAIKEEIRSPQSDKSSEKLLMIDTSDDMPDKVDAYTTHHPRPAAVCSFGSRYHNYSNGLGCHTFGRKSDHLRAAFLDLLERHLHPPPPKKLCVESKLPKEVHTVTNSKDPYDFDVVDPSQSNSRAIKQNAVLSHIPNTNKGVVKPKLKPPSANSANRTKSREGSAGSRSPGSNSNVNNNASGSSAKKRRNSGGSGIVTNTTTFPSQTTTAIVTQTNIANSIGSNNTGTIPSLIAIPSVNLSGTTINQISATLATTAKPAKNNVGFVLSGISQDPAILNGQYLNITGTQLSDLGATQIAIDDKSLQHAHLIGANNKTATSTKFINNFEALRSIHKNNLITVPPNTLLLEGVQPGTMLTPVSLTTAQANPVASVGQTTISPHQQNPTSTAPSPHIRSGSVSPQVSTSPLPNGVVSSPSDKDLILHRLPVFQSKGHPQKSSHSQASQLSGQQQQFQVSAAAPGFQFPSSAVLTTPTSSTTATGGGAVGQQQVCASQVLATQLTQLQMKNSNIHKGTSKLTMPVSLTIPFVTQSISGGVGMGGQHPTHALFITSEEAQKQGIHIHQAPDQQTAQQQNSPSSSLIS